MRVVLTGATGFIGQPLAGELIQSAELFCVTRQARRQIPGAVMVQADLSDPGFTSALPNRADAVIHLAVSAPSLNPAGRDMLGVNVTGTLEMLEYARASGVQRFIYASSGSVYTSSREPIAETACQSPNTLLGISKLAAELLVRTFASEFHGLIFRLFYVYGRAQPPNLLMSRLAESVRGGRPIIVDETGGPRLSVTYVEDVIRVFMAGLGLERSVTLNVAHPQPTRISEVAMTLGNLLGREPNIEYQTRGAPRDLIADVSLLREIVGWVPSVALQEGLRRAFCVRA